MQHDDLRHRPGCQPKQGANSATRSTSEEKRHRTLCWPRRNVWSNVHITDVVELYLLALKNAPAGSFYFVENGDTSYADIVATIATRLKLVAPQSRPVEEAIKGWGFGHAAYSFGSNSRVTAAKARKELGWKPTFTSVFDRISNDMAV